MTMCRLLSTMMISTMPLPVKSKTLRIWPPWLLSSSWSVLVKVSTMGRDPSAYPCHSFAVYSVDEEKILNKDSSIHEARRGGRRWEYIHWDYEGWSSSRESNVPEMGVEVSTSLPVDDLVLLSLLSVSSVSSFLLNNWHTRRSRGKNVPTPVLYISNIVMHMHTQLVIAGTQLTKLIDLPTFLSFVYHAAYIVHTHPMWKVL